MRQINRTAGNAVEFHRIKARDDVAGDAANGDGLPGADDEVGEGHHPAGGQTDGARENGGGVGDFSGGVGHGDHQFAVNPSDRKQERATDHETEKSAERAAAQKPVIHDDEPADADHGSPAESEVVGGAELAGESVHVVRAAIAGEKRGEL